MIKSLKFPDIFSSASTNTIQGSEATAQNLLLTLKAEKTSCFGDPYFGSNLKRFMFEQNNNVLRDLIIDDLYNSISMFLPQVKVKRKDIEIVSDGTTIYGNLKVTNLIDFKLEEVNIALFNIEELE